MSKLYDKEGHQCAGCGRYYYECVCPDEQIVIYLIPDDPNNDLVRKGLNGLSGVKVSEVICPPGVRDLYRMPFIRDGNGGRHFGAEGVDRFVKNQIMEGLMNEND